MEEEHQHDEGDEQAEHEQERELVVDHLDEVVVLGRLSADQHVHPGEPGRPLLRVVSQPEHELLRVVGRRPGLRVDDDHRRPLLAVQRRDLLRDPRSVGAREDRRRREPLHELPGRVRDDRRERLHVVDARVVLHPLVDREDAVEHPRRPDPALGGRLDDDEDRRQLALPEVLADEVDRVPRLGRGGQHVHRHAAHLEPAGGGHHQREHRGRDPDRDPRRAHDARDRGLPARAAPAEKPSRARRFQRSRCRCSSTSTTGRRRSPVTIAVAATIAIATATERITITGNRREHAPSSARA